MTESSQLSHQEEWEAQMEEYCRARQEGILTLKTLGHSELEVKSSSSFSSSSSSIIFPSFSHHKLFQALEAVSLRWRSGEPGDPAPTLPQQQQLADTGGQSGREVKQTKTKVGCFQRPKVKEGIIFNFYKALFSFLKKS